MQVVFSQRLQVANSWAIFGQRDLASFLCLPKNENERSRRSLVRSKAYMIRIFSDRMCRFSSVTLVTLLAHFASAEESTYYKAISSINASELKAHVDVLADDTFEGREAGSRGGRAAAGYLVRQFQKHGLRPAGVDGGYYQSFNRGFRNILGLLEGRDPELKNEVIVVSGHYDHVGYGTRRNSYGPTGYIHNGADDNASGTAGILEAIDACTQLSETPRRSVLFALWDGEEQGLLGSKHWVSQPTIRLDAIKLMINVDMIGRMRERRLEVYGSRTAKGLRKFVSQHNAETDMRLDFNWEMKENSDHYSFFKHGIPVLMFHTGLHDDYHRPSDDAHKVNVQGMQDAARMLFQVAYDLAERTELNGFRDAAWHETPAHKQRLETPLQASKPRLGVWMEKEKADTSGVVITDLKQGSAAEKGGLLVNDRVIEFDGQRVESRQEMVSAILHAGKSVSILLKRADEKDPSTVTLELDGNPVRLGISWRNDLAEPSTVIITRVVSGSPAQLSGLKAGDRIYAVGGREFQTSSGLLELLKTLPSPISVLVEREGRLRTLSLDVPPAKEAPAE